MQATKLIQRVYSTTASSIREAVRAANNSAIEKLQTPELYLTDVAPAKEYITAIANKKVILASGPPVEWHKRHEIQKGAIIGQVLFEKWADNAQTARKLLDEQVIVVESCNEHNAVGPLTGTISPNFPVFVVENKKHGTRSFSRIAEMWEMWGNHDKLPNLVPWKEKYAPALQRALRSMKEGLYLNPLLAQALEMGDDNGNRQIALTLLLNNTLALHMLNNGFTSEDIRTALEVLNIPSGGGGGPRAVIGISMAAAKAAVMPAENTPYSTIVTNMARNGAVWGIQVAGLGQQWFNVAAPLPNVVNFHDNPSTRLPYQPSDRCPDIGGDASIHETYGWSGMALSAASQRFLTMLGDLTVEQAFAYNKEMQHIATGLSNKFFVPALGSKTMIGCALGIDAAKVLKSGITPLIDTGVANKQLGHSVIARGLIRAPMACFEQALNAYCEKYKTSLDALLN